MADNNKAMSLENTKQYIKGILQGWFPNKATLDKLSTATNGDLLYNNQPVGSGGGTSITVDSALSSTSENPVQNKIIKSALDSKADVLTFDSAPTANSTNPVTSGGVYTALQNVSGGSTIVVDSVLNSTSENPVQNKAIYAALQNAGTGIGCEDASMADILQMLENIFGSSGVSVKIVDFANGTDQEIADMLAAHYAGEINIHNYWHVGDTRTISLSAIAATGVSESHAAQNVDIVLVNAGGYEYQTGKECAFVWQQKDGLIEPGYMNATNTNVNGWSGSARKTWCSSVYKQALPSAFRDLLKTCTIRTAQPNQSGVLYTDTQDDIFFSSMTEIYGTVTDGNGIIWTNGYEGNQWDYYKTEANIHLKKLGTLASNSTDRVFYWLRSPDRSNATSFMRVPCWSNPSLPKGSQASTVTAGTGAYDYHYAIAPCGFI